MLSRREFLRTTSAGFGALLLPPALLRPQPARAVGAEPVLVVLFLRGAADGLNLVVPHGDPRYYAIRPNIAVPAPSVLDLDGFFGLNPALAPLLPYHQSGELLAVHACGSPDPSRSHFDAQDFLECCAPGDKTIRDGWLNRYAAAAGFASPLAAVTVASRPVKALEGDAPTLAMPFLANYTLDFHYADERRAALEAIYAQAGGATARVAENAFAVLDAVRTVDPATSVPYPGHPFARALRDLAALVKAQVGVRVAAVDLGGWDHHIDQHTAFPASAGALASGLAAFAADLGSELGRTLVLVVTEFGRRAAENGSWGSDHGHGGVILALGGGVAGGRVLLRDDVWPGLEPAQLDQGDLAVTIDFRDVFAEALDRHMGLANLAPVFPAYTPAADRYPGLFA